MKRQLTASLLRTLLIIVLLLIITLTVGGFYFAQKMLTSYAVSVSQLNADADARRENIATLTRLAADLKKYQPVIEKAEKIVAESQSYAYQDQIVNDIVAIGDKANLKITGFAFEENTSTTSPTGATPTATPTTTPTATPSTTAPPVAIPGGVKSTKADITIGSPASYESILSFIKLVELSSTKMQIKEVSLTRTADGVQTPGFTIEVYIR